MLLQDDRYMSVEPRNSFSLVKRINFLEVNFVSRSGHAIFCHMK